MIELRLELPLQDFALDCALELHSGATGIFGPSGSGKTSLLEALAGWRRPRAGRIVVDGETLFDSAARVELPPERRRLGYVPQDALLLPHWNVRQNLEAAGALDRELLAVFELEPLLARDVRSLSGGERQRVALARALLQQPRLLLLDEPLTGLDHERRRRALALLVAVRQRFGVPLLFVSHDATDVQVLCDEVVVLERGRVRAQGASAAVLAAQHGPGFENLLRGTVRGGRLVLAGGVALEVPAAGLAEGTPAVFALRSEDVLVARGVLPRLSARNRLAARVLGLHEAQGELRLDALAGELPLRVRLTQGAVEELELAPGVEVTLVFKATSCRLVAA